MVVVAWSNLVSAQGPLLLGLGLRVWGQGLTILKTILAPTFSVSFPEVWLADQANSLVQVFLDLQFTVCLYSSPTDITNDWDSVVTTSDCKPASILWVTLIKCLPAWWRLAQCLR